MILQMTLVALVLLTCFAFYSNGDPLAQRDNKNLFANKVVKLAKRSENVPSEKTCVIEEHETKYYNGRCMTLMNGAKSCVGEGYMDPVTTQCDNDE